MDWSATRRAILAINLAVACLALHSAAIKWLAADYAVSQVVFLRNLFALLPILWLIRRGGEPLSLRTGRWPLYLLRTAAILGASFSFFLALRFLGLAEATAVGFAAPFIIAALSAPALGERVGWRGWSMIALGFAGVLIVLRPGAGVFQSAALLPLAAAFCYAVSMILSRALSRTESNGRIMLIPTLLAILACLPWTALDWRAPGPADWALFALIGLLAGLAFHGVTEAYRLAPASLFAPFDYAALLWSLLLGWLLWGELPGPWVYAGAAVIAVAGLVLLRWERRAPGPG